ncbi:hypothetical protein Tco_1174026 [Tanacetum coccineum]
MRPNVRMPAIPKNFDSHAEELVSNIAKDRGSCPFEYYVFWAHVNALFGSRLSVLRGLFEIQSVGDGGGHGFDSAVGQEIAEPSVPVAASAEATVPKPQRSKKKRVIYDSEGLPVAPNPPKRLRTDYGTAGGSVTGGKSLSALNRLLQDSRLTVEQGVAALPTLPFITSSVTALYSLWRRVEMLCFRIMTEAITVAPRWLIPADISKG